MNTRKIVLLMWKNYRLRRHKWIMTLLEILLPIGLFYLVAKSATMAGNRTPTIINDTSFSPMSEEEVKNYAGVYYDVKVIYTPSNTFTEEIVKSVTNNLKIRVQRKASTEEELELFLSQTAANHTAEDWIGIVFLNTSEEKENLNVVYKIRDTQTWNTKLLFPSDGFERFYHMTSPYIAQRFAAFQLALDGALIAYKSTLPKTEPKPLFFRAFPVPERMNENSFQAFISYLIGVAIAISIVVMSLSLIGNVIEEKQNGVKELMKLVGLEEWTIWLGWFLNYFLPYMVTFTAVIALLTLPINGTTAAVGQISPIVLWLFFMLICVVNIFFGFVFCAIFHQATIATTIYFIVVLASSALAKYSMDLSSLFFKYLSCLLPSGALFHGVHILKYFEVAGIPLTWSSLNVSEQGTTSLSFLIVMLMLILDSIVYLFLAYYITEINPGKFGSAKSPFFIFAPIRSLFTGKDQEQLINLESDVPENKYMEKPSQQLQASIQIKDLHKRFGPVYAVKGLNLNIYQGEITALLGHNGAGKTTTMSIMTGLTSATAGSIHYKSNNGEEIDVFKNMTTFREKIGMCAQEDRLFPYLTSIEHLLFFGMLKGATLREAKEEAIEYLRMMEVYDKRNSTAGELSGGQKRKLCLAISLMGKSETLILDEPTSGLDVESRRKLWDLLGKLRTNRTIILTTHHMEEADALGDRIAIMHHGALVCHGTSMFLKKAYDTGYKLVLTTTKSANEHAITQAIHNQIEHVEQPENKIEHDTTYEIEYNLPIGELPKFSSLFQVLENQKGSLHIANIGVSCTTMEQVFLKVGGFSAADTRKYDSLYRNKSVTDGSRTVALSKKKVGLALILQQIPALLFKKWLYVSRNLHHLFTRILLPTLLSMFLLRSLAETDKTAEPPITCALNLYPNAKVIGYSDPANAQMLSNHRFQVEKLGGTFIDSKLADINQEILNFGKTDLNAYRYELITAATFNQSSNTLMYSDLAFHSLPIVINLYSNTLLKSAKDSSITSITTINHPVQVIMDSCDFVGSQVGYTIFWFFAVPFYAIDLSAYFIEFLNIERIDGFKHIQMMSNLNPAIYWIAVFLYDYLFFVLIMIFRLFLYSFFDTYGLLTFQSDSWVIYSMILLYGVSGLLFVYVISYVFNSKHGSYVLFFFVNMIGAVVTTIYYMINTHLPDVDTATLTWYIVLYRVTRYVIYFVPPLNFSMIFIKCVQIWFNNKRCEYCSSAILKQKCEEKIIYQDYFVYGSTKNPNGILYEVLFAYGSIVIYAFLLMIINMGYFEKFRNWLVTLIYSDNVTTISRTELDGDVKMEHERVDEIRRRTTAVLPIKRKMKNTVIPRKQSTWNRSFSLTESNELDPLIFGEDASISVVAEGLRKNYIKWFRPKTAVANVSFAIKEKECFGLLGVNGAGKSTTFGMLTAAIVPTKGDAVIHNIRLSKNKTEYLSKVGYCPQTNCFIEELTGRQMLTMIAKLRGVYSKNIKDLVAKWTSILGLEEYQNQRCGTYSGGNKRKLCTAMALIGDPMVVFLDEPTSGVDPVSRKNLYDVMENSRASGQTVVLTSHSMEECENLCDRLTILVAGEMRCIGTVQHLKKRYAQGFSILIKTANIADDSQIEDFKQAVINSYGSRYCILKDEHKGLLYFHVSDTNMLWSTLFKTMETLKEEFDILEDYTITDTTLEEVFISFAKTTDE